MLEIVLVDEIAMNLYASRCKGGTESAKTFQTQSNIDAIAVADALENHVPYFDRTRFLTAAGVPRSALSG